MGTFVPSIVNSMTINIVQWWLTGSSFDLLFTNQLAHGTSGNIAFSDVLSISRASNGYATNADGSLTLYGNDTFRFGVGTGLLIETGRTNVVLWNRDLTNAAWTPTNITPLKDQTGADGVVNSASSLLATAGNGTILQAITDPVSNNRYSSCYIKRITGTGTVNMTVDNGATWTAVVPTSSWSKVTIPNQVLTNPTIGFQIVTSGDKIAVDFVQCEEKVYSSPIATTTTTVTRAFDNIQPIGALNTLLKGSVLSIVMDVKYNIYVYTLDTMLADNTNQNFFFYGDADPTDVYSSIDGAGSHIIRAVTGGPTLLTGVKLGYAADATGRSLVMGGGTVVGDAFPVVIAGSINLMSTQAAVGDPGYVRRLTVWPSRVTDPVLQGYTAP